MVVCLVILVISCEHRLRVCGVSQALLLLCGSCHARTLSTGAVLWRNKDRAPMFNNVVQQHAGLSRKTGRGPPSERQCLLLAAHGAVSRGAGSRL